MAEDGGSRCPKCREMLGGPVASICGSVMGDEVTDCYYYCGACGLYFLELSRDSFTLGESSHFSDPLPKAEGEARLALIRRCETPWDKRCRCGAHKEYFGGWLD
ncbi:MAG: hypothetical protein IT158_05930 [Bryobacterales bacterium]|nr:hypothetical protein [Bryobacterales bacterium]